MRDPKALMAPLALRAKVAFAARCAQIAMERLGTKVRGRDRRLFDEAIEACLRVVERDDHGDDGELAAFGNRWFELSQKPTHGPIEAQLLGAIGGACFSASEYGRWLTSSLDGRNLRVDSVVDAAAYAFRGVLEIDPAVDAELFDLRDRLAARVTSDEKPVPRAWLAR